MDSGTENSLGNAPATEGNTPSNTLVKCDWDDEIFLKEFALLAACNARPQLSQGILAAKALLNWYMGGDKPNNPTDTILTTFYCMEIKLPSSPSLFTDKLMVNGPELPPVSAVEKIDPKKYYSKLMRVPTKKKEKLPDGAFTRELASKWYNDFWKMLEDESHNDNQMAVNIIGFLYMIMMRLSVKDVHSVSKYILEKGKSSFQTLGWGYLCLGGADMFCPPHKAMAMSFKVEYARLQPNCIKVMSAIVYSLYDGLKDVDQEEMKTISGGEKQRKIQRILNAGCLASLEKTGLGLLSWTVRATSALGFDRDIVKLTNYVVDTSADQRHEETILPMLRLLIKLNGKKPAQVTWHWARLFKDGALTDFRIAKNPLYVMIMVAIVLSIGKGTDMWNIPSLNKKDVMAHKEEATLHAKRIQEKLKLDGEHQLKRQIEQMLARMNNRVPSGGNEGMRSFLEYLQ